MSASIKDLLGQTGGKSAKFDSIGDMIAGPILSTQVVQVRNFQTNEPETWDNGDPKQQIVITVQSDSRDGNDPEDDGVRSVYVKWWGLQRRALQEAVKAAGDDDIRVGGHFSAAYVADGEQKARGFNPPKIYQYTYAPPSPTAGLIQQTASTPQASPVQAVAAPAPVAAPPAAQQAADPQAALAQIKALITAGLTDAQIAAAVPQFTADAVAAVRAIPAA